MRTISVVQPSQPSVAAVLQPSQPSMAAVAQPSQPSAALSSALKLDSLLLDLPYSGFTLNHQQPAIVFCHPDNGSLLPLKVALTTKSLSF